MAALLPPHPRLEWLTRHLPFRPRWAVAPGRRRRGRDRRAHGGLAEQAGKDRAGHGLVPPLYSCNSVCITVASYNKVNGAAAGGPAARSGALR